MTNMTTNGGIYRRATPDDYQGVLDIGDVFGGFDYMPSSYHRYMKDPNFYSFVCEVKGQVAGMQFIHVIDDGRTAYQGGARVHKDHRGKDITNLLRRHCLLYVKSLHPEAVKNAIYTSANNAFQKQALVEKPDQYKLLIERAHIHCKAHTDNIYQFLTEIEVNNQQKEFHLDSVHHPSETEFLTELSRADVQAALFPDRIIQAQLEAFQILPSNLKHIYEESHIVWSWAKEKHEQDTKKCASLLSTIRAYQCRDGIRLDVEVHGFDQEMLGAHVLAALYHVQKKYPGFHGLVAMTVSYELKMTLQESDIFASKMNWKEGMWGKSNRAWLLKFIEKGLEHSNL